MQLPVAELLGCFADAQADLDRRLTGLGRRA
jgi:hypothetical protein